MHHPQSTCGLVAKVPWRAQDLGYIQFLKSENEEILLKSPAF